MILATEIATLEDRKYARQHVHFHESVRWLAVGLLRTINYGSIDLIDKAIGQGHGRGILVATHEGVDRLLGTTLDLMECATLERVLDRHQPADPMGLGETLPEPGLSRMRSRLARIPLEGAVMRLAAAGNDLVNAHLLLAWESNCTTEDELAPFGLRPQDSVRNRWTTIELLRRELPSLRKKPIAVLPGMWLTDRLEDLLQDEAVSETRLWRDALAHRERLGMADSPAFGRTSLWETPEQQTTFPRVDMSDVSLPTLAQRRDRLIQAAAAVLDYAQAVWAVERQFFSSVGIDIVDSREEGMVRVDVHPQGPASAPERVTRDPGRLLSPPPGWG
jgi:hypothetical protein